MKRLSLLVITATLAASMFGALESYLPVSAKAKPVPLHKLNPTERVFVAAQTAVGRKSVRFLILAKAGSFDAVVGKLKGISAELGPKDTDIGLIRARIPIDRIQDALGWPEIAAIETEKASFTWQLSSSPVDRVPVAEVGLFCEKCSVLDSSVWIKLRGEAFEAGKPMPDRGDTPEIQVPIVTSMFVIGKP
jgi:hypothetical protein